MNILSMLTRLEHALSRPGLAKEMVLLPSAGSELEKSSEVVNLVVGYNGSPRSQTALDLTLWIAHQTRLATQKQVTVQVVYVVDLSNACGQIRPFTRSLRDAREGVPQASRTAVNERLTTADVARQASSLGSSAAGVLAQPTLQSCRNDQFEQADQILWQARTLAEEWRGSLETHLRFGHIGAELRDVVKAETATLLLLGCEAIDHPIVQQLGDAFPCPVLGIPTAL